MVFFLVFMLFTSYNPPHSDFTACFIPPVNHVLVGSLSSTTVVGEPEGHRFTSSF